MAWSLYFRYGCGLCDEMKLELDDFISKQKPDRRIEYQLIDIDSEEGLRSRFNEDVPLLMNDGAVVLKYFFDEAHLTKVLNI
jgi:hypothetical protein